MKATAALFLNEGGWSHGHRSGSQLSPAHLWRRVHLEGLAGNGSGRAGQMLQIREEICSWVALGKLAGALAEGGGEKGHLRKVQRKRSLPCFILQGLLNNHLLLACLGKGQLNYKARDGRR